MEAVLYPQGLTLWSLRSGRLKPSEFAVVFTTAFLGAAVGQNVVNYVIVKSGRQSVVVFLLSFLTGISIIAILITAFQGNPWHERAVDFYKLCAQWEAR